MMIIMMKEPKIWPDKDLELWAIPQTGARVSTGLLSKRQKTLMEVECTRDAHDPKTTALAISRQPKGGLPTGGATEPVMSQGQLVAL